MSGTEREYRCDQVRTQALLGPRSEAVYPSVRWGSTELSSFKETWASLRVSCTEKGAAVIESAVCFAYASPTAEPGPDRAYVVPGVPAGHVPSACSLSILASLAGAIERSIPASLVVHRCYDHAQSVRVTEAGLGRPGTAWPCKPCPQYFGSTSTGLQSESECRPFCEILAFATASFPKTTLDSSTDFQDLSGPGWTLQYGWAGPMSLVSRGDLQYAATERIL
eukprot:3941827-Rhodomonas_salina.4